MLTLNVAGMSCGHCQQRVTEAVRALPGVAHVAVDLGAGQVTVDGSADAASIRQAITDAGYDVLSPSEA